jgi:hypothetical protein
MLPHGFPACKMRQLKTPKLKEKKNARKKYHSFTVSLDYDYETTLRQQF